MTWTERVWELVVDAISWLIALVAFAGILAFVMCDGIRRWRRRL